MELEGTDLHLLGPPAPWEGLRARFRWPAPLRYNIAHEVCARWATHAPQRAALVVPGNPSPWRYGALDRASRRLANALSAAGVARGDRVAVLLPQVPEALLTHLAAYRLGAIVVPLFTLFGADALAFRLADSGARALVTDGANLPKLDGLGDGLPHLTHILSIDGPGPGAQGFWEMLERAADTDRMEPTGPDDPALLSYTSGTTGPPKGALHGHRVLLGHLPGFILSHEFAPQPGDLAWTPADWAWMGGLMDILMPALALGIPVLAHRSAKFDPDDAVALMRAQDVRTTFLPPTALKLMRSAGVNDARFLRTVASGGEALGADLLAWGRSVFGRAINEFYGQTECNLVLSNCAQILPPRPGFMGKAVPGFEVAVLDAGGAPVAPGIQGEIAVKSPNPSMFLGYWNQPEKTAAKFHGPWLRTGDEGQMDADGYVQFAARSDDVITSSGYRIGPSEVEECLARHPDVALAGVVGIPDAVRGQVVRAVVVLAPGAQTHGLEARLIAHVRETLSPHLAPREVRIAQTLPMTATGKILRRALKDQP